MTAELQPVTYSAFALLCRIGRLNRRVRFRYIKDDLTDTEREGFVTKYDGRCVWVDTRDGLRRFSVERMCDICVGPALTAP